MLKRLVLAAALASLASAAFAQVPPGPVTPTPGPVNTVAVGGTAVTPVAGPVNGCYIMNPLTATDEGLGTAEPLYVDPITTATTAPNASNVAIAPGGVFNCIVQSRKAVSVNAASSGHKFTVVRW